MNTKELFLIMDKFEKSSLSELHVEENENLISLKRQMEQNVLPPTVPKSQVGAISETVQVEETGICVKAPLIGTFYRASSPEAKAYVNVGDEVKKGDILGLIEAMKLMNEIVAPVDGTIEEIFVENEDLVQFDELLIKMKE